MHDALGLRAQALLYANRNQYDDARRLLWQAIAIANSSRIEILELVLLNQLEGLAREIDRPDEPDES